MVPITNINDERWLLEGESQTLEFKTSFDKTTVESLVAFANAQGGTVLQKHGNGKSQDSRPDHCLLYR